jgi:tetratricopeptide (TPR) repeat protein
MALSRLGRLDEAEAALRAALGSADQPGVDGALGTVLLRQGQSLTAANRAEEANAKFEEARIFLENELERTPDSLPLLTNYSTVLEHADPEGALPAVLAKLMEAEPEQRTFHLHRLAKWHFDRGETNEALAVLEQLPRSDRDGAGVAYAIAARLFNDGQVAEATRVAEMGLEFDAKQADLYRLLSRAYLSEDRKSDAIGALKRFLELRPDDPEAAIERELLARLEALENP